VRATPTSAVLDRLATLELGICLRLRLLSSRRTRAVFAGVSRAGDGWFWLALALLLPAAAGAPGWDASFEMLRVAGLCLPVYKVLKRTTARPRPGASLGLDPLLQPLDLYSFPSGHTLHAVAFTLVVAGHFPDLLWILVPFTALVALSRLVLSLHYPTDVAAGACLGALIAWLVP
jgi:undecaprenyl-diphosphatase